MEVRRNGGGPRFRMEQGRRKLGCELPNALCPPQSCQRQPIIWACHSPARGAGSAAEQPVAAARPAGRTGSRDCLIPYAKRTDYLFYPSRGKGKAPARRFGARQAVRYVRGHTKAVDQGLNRLCDPNRFEPIGDARGSNVSKFRANGQNSTVTCRCSHVE